MSNQSSSVLTDSETTSIKNLVTTTRRLRIRNMGLLQTHIVEEYGMDNIGVRIETYYV